jgi:hypothetical protein
VRHEAVQKMRVGPSESACRSKSKIELLPGSQYSGGVLPFYLGKRGQSQGLSIVKIARWSGNGNETGLTV